MENPYQVNSSKSHLDTDAKLTRRVLKIYKKYQGRDMPMLDLLGMHAMSWLVFALVILPLMLFWIWLLRNGNLATVPMVGFVLGVLFA